VAARPRTNTQKRSKLRRENILIYWTVGQAGLIAFKPRMRWINGTEKKNVMPYVVRCPSYLYYSVHPSRILSRGVVVGVTKVAVILLQ
jgi:hypothetical protein